MNLHEYQSKQLFAQYAIPIPKGVVAGSPEEAVAAAQRLGGSLWVVKAQVHAGGRSKAGGMDIEEVALHSPEKIIRVNIHPTAGLQDCQCRQLAFGLGVSGSQIAQFGKMAQALYKLYLERDASLVEVNPLRWKRRGSRRCAHRRRWARPSRSGLGHRGRL
jgi:succinyl-CoA synthetase beta subunit